MNDREREAAKHPRRGDRWRKTTKTGRVIERTAVGVDFPAPWKGQRVLYMTSAPLADAEHRGCTTESWQAWCCGAELVERGGK